MNIGAQKLGLFLITFMVHRVLWNTYKKEYRVQKKENLSGQAGATSLCAKIYIVVDKWVYEKALVECHKSIDSGRFFLLLFPLVAEALNENKSQSGVQNVDDV